MANVKAKYPLMQRLVQQELLAPRLEANLIADNWPDKYTIEVDSSPYYGSGDGYFHPSSHCTPGERFLYYLMHPDTHFQRERRTLTSALTLAFGSAVHAIIQEQLKIMGICTDDDIEIELTNVKHHWRGHMDLLAHLPSGDYPVDIKTMNSRMFKTIKEAKSSWNAQLNCYMDQTGYDEGILLVVESGYPFALQEFRIKRDDQLLEELYAKWDRVREAIARNEPPQAKCCALDSPQMAKCAAREICLQTY